ncbi:hypothetical protein C8F04DRAFT_1181224 [Mycena alexandri]|uniref:Uncharacterized protein n=1 Tax=Mycena alexandri TaxID=1745969 RepID=A0AAD6T128_9AGAR|nr:hypothetical protein C8F04DRAFT_1181224 [Mycena alexandri]
MPDPTRQDLLNDTHSLLYSNSAFGFQATGLIKYRSKPNSMSVQLACSQCKLYVPTSLLPILLTFFMPPVTYSEKLFLALGQTPPLPRLARHVAAVAGRLFFRAVVRGLPINGLHDCINGFAIWDLLATVPLLKDVKGKGRSRVDRKLGLRHVRQRVNYYKKWFREIRTRDLRTSIEIEYSSLIPQRCECNIRSSSFFVPPGVHALGVVRKARESSVPCGTPGRHSHSRAVANHLSCCCVEPSHAKKKVAVQAHVKDDSFHLGFAIDSERS